MAGTFKFELVSPEALVISADVEHVVVPGTEGDFGVLAGHTAFISTLRPGVLEIRGAQGVEKRIYVRGGFAEAGPDSLTVLAQQAVDVSAMTRESLDKEIEAAQDELKSTEDTAKRLAAQSAVDQLTLLRNQKAN